MAKKRVIFKLIYNEGIFCLSRNFFLQKTGDIKWLVEKMKFDKISSFIDELIILNASKNNKIDPLPYKFKKTVETLMKRTFIPLTIGGGLTKINQIEKCFDLGADKVLLNSVLSSNPNLIKICSSKYGAQAVSIGIDFKFNNSVKNFFSFINNGETQFLTIRDHLKLLDKFDFGELVLTSVDKDGTGFGFDDKILKFFRKGTKVPILLSGGAGKPEHFESLIENKKISGLVTGNLYNFLGNGLELLRSKIISNGTDLRIL
jgi:imidazole glycerol-phosphate synthase subunit HisF